MRWLDERGIGVAGRARRRPTRPRRATSCRSCRPRSCSTSGSAMRRSGPMRRRATRPARRRRAKRPAEGNVGAGAGASVGKLFGIGRAMKRRHRHASIEVGGIKVAALVAVNAIGDVVDPAHGPHRRRRAHRRRQRARRHNGALQRGEVPASLQRRSARRDDARHRRHRRGADQGRGDQGRADGARRPGAQHPAGPHDERRRRRLRARHRRERQARAHRPWSVRSPPRCSPRRSCAACAPPTSLRDAGLPALPAARDLAARPRDPTR